MRTGVVFGTAVAGLAGMVGLAGLTGCSASADAGAKPGPVVDAESPAPSSDPGKAVAAPRKKVTTTDYEAAVRLLDACLRRAGVELFNDGWDPVDNERMLLRYKPVKVSSEEADEAYQRCFSTKLDAVATRFNEDNKSRMEAPLMAAVQACLKSRKIQMSGDEQNPSDLLAAVPEARQQELRDCVRTSVAKVYPDLFSTSFP